MASALDRTMSLTSVREDGLFTGEEITIKNTLIEQQCNLAVVIEADENTYEEDVNISSSIVIVPSVDSSSTAEYAESQSQEGDPQHHEHIEIAISPIQSQEESTEEGVDAILVEHGRAPILTETEHISHCIHSESRPPPLASQERSVSFSFKRNITRKMNRAAHKVKNALGNASKNQGNVNIDSASSQDIVSEARDENNRIHLSLPTPRAAQTIEEASSHFDELSVQPTVDATTETPRRKNASNNMEATRTEYDRITHAYDKLDQTGSIRENSDASIEYNIEQSSQIQSNHHMLSNLSKESEQFDPDYQGPYDDNKSLLTHSTGDFSQMYSRSWSTIGNHNVASAIGRISWSRGRSNSPYIGSRERVDVINESFCQAEDKEFGEDKIMVVPKERRRDGAKEMGGGISLDGLSLVNSVVGDDRSYVEDY